MMANGVLRLSKRGESAFFTVPFSEAGKGSDFVPMHGRLHTGWVLCTVAGKKESPVGQNRAGRLCPVQSIGGFPHQLLFADALVKPLHVRTVFNKGFRLHHVIGGAP